MSRHVNRHGWPKIDKWAWWHEIDGICEWCGKWMPPNDVSCQIHHVLVPRRYLGAAQQHKPEGSVDQPINVMLICAHPCHDILGADYDAGKQHRVDRYTEEEVEAYLQIMLPNTAVRR